MNPVKYIITCKNEKKNIVQNQLQRNIQVTLTVHHIFGIKVVHYRLKVFTVVKVTL